MTDTATAWDASTTKKAVEMLERVLTNLIERQDIPTAIYYAARLEQFLIDASTRLPADTSDTKSDSSMEKQFISHLIGTRVEP